MCKTEPPTDATSKAQPSASSTQSSASTTAKRQKQPLHKQSQGVVPNSLTFCLFVWAVAQEVMRPSDMRMSMKSCLYVLVVSYIYCDYWLWMLHCFLDRKENLKSRIPDIAEFARKFQEHHDFPAQVLHENHLGEINDLVSGVAGMGLLLGYWTSPASKLIVIGVTLWGAVGGMNHFCCHAISHGYQVPAFFKYGQQWGLLPTSRHHKIHHTAPHEENWNFLNGFYFIYEPLYYATGSSYKALFAMFYTCNPILAQTWLLALGILA
mmetsp:Transcript_144270/g.251483  ORF Transcript_144270/g.251483 Transcript_144270/m.251483 type:complete len:266 (+) Transcript_144270:169-966(+)